MRILSLARRCVPGLAALCGFALAAAAQQNAKGSADHPLLSRYPNSRIAQYEQGHNAAQMLVAGAQRLPAKRQTVEGQLTRIRYFHNDRENQPSALQVLRNHQNAVKAAGGKMMYERPPEPNDGGETTLAPQYGGKEVWVRVKPDIFGSPTQSCLLEIVGRGGMEQVLTAARLLEDLKRI